MTVSVAQAPAPRAAIHSGQIVASQVAVALWMAAWGRGAVPIAAATLGAVALLALSWVPVRHRWLYQWAGLLAGYATRRRGAGGALLAWVHPGARITAAEVDHDPAGVIEDAAGRAALLELDDPAVLVAEDAVPLPPLASLLPPSTPDAPRIRLHLVISGVPPLSGAGAPATSYRQLTEGRLLAHQRAVLAVQVLRGEGVSEDDLRRALSGAVRRVRRRLGATVGVRLLAPGSAEAVLLDLAHHDGAAPVRETWHAALLGGFLQASYRLRGWADQSGDSLTSLVPRLLSLPAAAITVGLCVGPRTGEAAPAALTARIATGDPAALTVAGQALRRIVAGFGATAIRLDGQQARGLAATLPLGVLHNGQPVPLGALNGLVPPLRHAGLVLGVNRRNEPVTVRLFRAEPTRAMLAGGLRAAELVTLRALALGARVVVLSARPGAWEPFVRGVAAPGESVIVVPPSRPLPALGPGSALRPQLIVADAGPAPASGEQADAPTASWRTTLVVRDSLVPADVDPLARADLVVLQPLAPAEAAIAASALGLGAAQEWLTRIRGDMVGVVNRRTVRWVLLSATQVEQQLLGTPARA